MTKDELIVHLKSEVRRVKMQRNDYEQRWLKAIKDMEELKHLYNLPSYLSIIKEIKKNNQL